MMMLRILLAVALVLASPVSAAEFDSLLRDLRIKGNGDIRLREDLKIGRFQSNRYIAEPDAIQIPNLGTAGDAFRLGPAQTTPFGQLGTLSTAYPGVTVNRDAFRVLIGVDPNAELGTVAHFGGGVGSSQAIVGVVNTPAGNVDPTKATWPDAALAGYAYTAGGPLGKAAVGVYGMGGATANGVGVVDGANFVSINCKGQAPECTTGGGFDFLHLAAVEVNKVMIKKPGGGAPEGAAFGFIANLNAEIQNTGALFAYDAQSFTGVKWKVGYQTENAAADIGVRLGSENKGANQNSQKLQFIGYDASGAAKISSIQGNSLGDIAFYPADGNYVNVTAAFPQLTAGSGGAAVGTKIVTSATTGASATSILETGTPGSNAIFTLNDGGNLQIATGAGVAGGLVLNPTTGGIKLLGIPNGGTAAGTLCVAAGNVVFVKITPGACL